MTNTTLGVNVFQGTSTTHARLATPLSSTRTPSRRTSSSGVTQPPAAAAARVPLWRRRRLSPPPPGPRHRSAWLAPVQAPSTCPAQALRGPPALEGLRGSLLRVALRPCPCPGPEETGCTAPSVRRWSAAGKSPRRTLEEPWLPTRRRTRVPPSTSPRGSRCARPGARVACPLCPAALGSVRTWSTLHGRPATRR